MWPASLLPSALSLSLVPASLQKRLARFLLKRALGSVLILTNQHFDLDTQIDVSLQGLALRDVQLNLDSLNSALRKANLPLLATRGVLGSVSVTVPWLDLTGSSCTVQLDGVQLELSPIVAADEDNDQDSASSTASSSNSSPFSSALHDHSHPQSAMLASSIYIANEFLRHGATSPSPEPEDPPLAESLLSASISSDPAASSSGLEGVQLLAGLIDTIIANLVIHISNTSITLANHPTPDTPSLAVQVPSITVDRASASFFEASKRVSIPQFRVRTHGDDERDPILWAPEPVVIELVVPSTANRPASALTSTSPATPASGAAEFVARVDIPDLVARVTPADLGTLLAWMSVLDPPSPPPSPPEPAQSTRHVSWTSPAAAATSPSPPVHSDEDDSDFEQTDDDFLTSATSASRPSASAAAATVFYSAIHTSVLAPTTQRGPLAVHVHQASLTLATADNLSVVVSLGSINADATAAGSWACELGPVGVVVNGATVVHVPDRISVRGGRVGVGKVQVEVARPVVEALMGLVDAIPRPPSRPRPRDRGGATPGMVVDVAEVDARVHGYVPGVASVAATNVRVDVASGEVSVGTWAVGLVDKVSWVGSRDVSTITRGAGEQVTVACARVDAVLTREDYLMLVSTPPSPSPNKPASSSPTIDLSLSSLVLTLPTLATRPEIHLLGLDLSLEPALANKYKLRVRRGHLVSHGARLVEYVARPSSAGSGGHRTREMAMDVQGQGSIHEIKLSGLCVVLKDKLDVGVLKAVGDVFNVPPPPPHLPPPPPLTTSLHIRDSTLRLIPPTTCHPASADLDLECIDVVIRTGPRPGHVLLTGTLHALALTVAGYPVATVEGCKLSAHGEPQANADHDQMRFRVTLDRPNVKVHVTPESVAAGVMVMRAVQAAFTDPPPAPAAGAPPVTTTTASAHGPDADADADADDAEPNLFSTVDPVAFANRQPKPTAYDMDRLTLSIVQDFEAFESELDSQVVLIDPLDAAGSSGSDLDSSGTSSRASSVAGLDLIDDHFADDPAAATDDGDESMWSPLAAPPTRDGPVEWTWHLVVDGLSASVELSTSSSADASSAEFGSVPEVPIVALDVFDVHVEHSLWAPGHPGGVLDTLTVTVGTLEVRDLVPMSPWNKMVTAARTPASVTPVVGGAARGGGSVAAHARAKGGEAARVGVPGGTALPFARMDATCVLGPGAASGGGGGGGGEWRAKVRVVPIKLHVFQETVDSVVQFASSVVMKIADDDEELVLINPPSPSPTAATVPPVVSPSVHTNVRPPPFFQRIEVHPISLRIDYKPKSVDLPALQRGNMLELLNVFHLEGAEMTLRHVTVTGARGWDGLADALVSYWVPHVRNTQLPGMVSGVGPLRSLVNIGTGVADLFLLPVEQYRRDGRLVKGLKKGAHSFVRTAAVETLSLGAKLAVGTHTILERADTMVSTSSSAAHTHDHASSSASGTSSPILIPGRSPDLHARRRSASATTPASPGSPSHHPLGRSSPSSASSPRTISKYANQPSNTREGLEQAMRTLTDNVTQAARVIAIPVEVMERDGATGTMRAVLRAVPIAVLKPMLGATDAVGKTLMGMRNGLDPERRREVRDKYKAANG